MKTIDKIILDRAETSCLQTAVVAGDTSLSYGDLATKVRSVAAALSDRGIGRGDIVAVCAERQVDLVPALLGIMMSGAAYLPLDPSYPEARLEFMVADSDVSLVLSGNGDTSFGRPVLTLDEAVGTADPGTVSQCKGAAAESDLAYIIYTSGTTGTPKGVMVEHRSFFNFLMSMRMKPGLGPDDRMVAVTPISFDIFALELYLPLLVGGTVVLVPRDVARDVDRLAVEIDRTGGTVMQATPATWRMLVETGWTPPKGFRKFVGGEAFPDSIAGSLLAGEGEVVNLYGPTETTIWSAMHPVTEALTRQPIGRPIANTQLHILSPTLERLPNGAVGELYIGGAGVARGYNNRPGLTAERFLPDPFSRLPGARLYRTGDLARIVPGGQIECLGRSDHQVKIHGYRIELGEVEAALESLEKVRAAAATTFPDGLGEQRIVGYIVGEIEGDTARDLLASILPAHMVPDFVQCLDKLPLTPNGKIDRKALPEPGGTLPQTGAQEPPKGDVETRLAAIWQEVLGVPVVGRDDDFFRLGGSSLLATRVGARIRAEFGVPFALRTLFDERTVAACSAAIGDAAISEQPVIVRNDSNRFPLIPAQSGLAFLDTFGAAGGAYHGLVAMDVEGIFDASAFSRALARVSIRHDALQVRFVEDGEGGIVQEITGENPPVRIETVTCEANVSKALDAFAAEPFDIACGPLLRVMVLEHSAGFVLAFAFHHIILDAWSFGILARELTAIYREERGGVAAALTEPTLRYRDAATWLDTCQDQVVSDVAWWREKLEDAPLALELPTDYVRPAVQSFRGSSIPFSLPDTLVSQMRALAVEEAASPFMVLVAALSVTLGSLAGQRDVCLGTPVAGRDHPDLEDVVGFFLNTVTLRSRWQNRDSFRDMLKAVRETVLDAFAHQSAPFDRVVEGLAHQPDLSRQPVFQTMVILDNVGMEALDLGEASWRYRNQARQSSKYDLTLNLAETAQGMSGLIEYAADLFRPETVERIGDLLQQTLKAMVDNPDERIQSLRFDGLADSTGTMVSNIAHARPAVEETLTATVAAHVAREPSAIVAISLGGDLITRQQLWDQSGTIAGRLLRAGVEPGDRVAVMTAHDVPVLAAVLGILRTGAAYVPLDPKHPDERLSAILSHSGASAIVYDEVFEIRAAAIAGALAGIPVSAGPLEAPAERRSSGSLSYILYTSGTTGRPKGVFQNDRNVLHHAANYASSMELSQGDVVSLIPTVAFDAAVMDIWGALVSGATLAFWDVSNDGVVGIEEWLSSRRVNVWHSTPSLLRAAVDLFAGPVEAPVRAVVLGGEEARQDDAVRVARCFPGAQLVNGLGPTESTLALQAAIDPSDAPVGGRLPIGKAVPGCTVKIMDGDGCEAPFVGELVFESDHIALGYWADPKATAEAFVPAASGRAYRTGDVARRRLDGALEFLGRRDRQLKVNGIRVEPAEVAARISELPGVENVHVGAGPDGRLAAWVVPKALAPDAVPASAGNGPLMSILFFGEQDGSHEGERYGLTLAAARRADILGLHAIWTPERHFTEIAAAFPNPSLLAAALARETRRIGLRAGSVVLPLHHPLRVAEEWAVVDNLSGGRAGVSFAPGWVPHDFVFAPEDYDDRHDVMLSHIETVRKLWCGEAVSFRSGTGEEHGYRTGPRPVQDELPMWLTVSRNPKMFTEAGRRGLNVLTSVQNQTRDQLAANVRAYRDGRAAAGLDPATGHVTVMMHSFVAATTAEAEAKARPALRGYIASHAALRRSVIESLDVKTELTEEDDFERLVDVAVDRYLGAAALIGGPAALAERAMELYDIGVDEIAGLVDFGVDSGTVIDALDHLAVMSDAVRSGLSPERLRDRLRAVLPSAMVPEDIQFLRDLPLTVNGKVDHANLPAPERRNAVGGGVLAGPTQAKLAEMYSDLLGVQSVGPADSFFVLGGHSLLAMRLAVRIKADLHTEVPLRAIFEAPTVAGLASWIERQGVTGASLPEPHKASRDEPLPLSFGQERLWMMETLGEAKGRYNVPFLLRLDGDLDVVALERAFEALAMRHEALRLRLVETADGLRQVFTDGPGIILDRRSARSEEAALNAAEELIVAPFDLFAEAPWRLTLYSCGEGVHILVMVMHHMVSDAWSTAIMGNDLAVLYAAETGETGSSPALPQNALGYGDFAVWLREVAESGIWNKDLGYWQDMLAGPPPALELPADRSRPAVHDGRGASVGVTLPATVRQRVMDLAAKSDATPFIVVLTAFQIVLAQWSAQRDFCVGTPVAGRLHPAFDDTVGYFSNTLALRTDLAGEPTFHEAVSATKARVLDALAHQNAPFEQVVEALAPVRDLSRHPLFQVAFTLEPAHKGGEPMQGVSVRRMAHDAGTAKFDLSLLLVDNDDSIAGVCEYSTALFEEKTARRLVDALVAFLSDVDATGSVFDVPIPGPVEGASVAFDEHRSEKALSACQGSRIEEVVSGIRDACGERIALEDGEDVLSYEELVSTSDALSGRIASAGVMPGQIVGVALERSANAIIAQLAVLRAGGVVLPLDPDYPPERLEGMLADSDVPLVLSDTRHQGLAGGRPVLLVDEADINAEDVAPPPRLKGLSGAPAYVIYTSGSTGRPKGVMVPHEAVTSLFLEREVMNFGPDDRVMLASPLAFDASLIEIWGALLNGSRLAVLPAGPFDPDALSEFVADAGVTVAWLTAGLLRGYLERDPSAFAGLRLLMSGGDVFPTHGLSDFMAGLPNVQFVNGYGPTECTTFTAMHRLDFVPEAGSAVPIGRGVGGRRPVVLDRSMRAVPPGAPGELYVGGHGLSLGYLGQPGRTAESFLPDPAGGGGRLYRTGDRVRLRSDGALEFLGRIDAQVKLRGFRVEPGEVEAALCALPAVGDGAVAVRRDGEGAATLEGFVVPVSGVGTDARSLEQALGERLPSYMVPRITLVESLPLDANGKVDRRSLVSRLPERVEEAGEAPHAGLEKTLAEIWQRVLGRSDIRRADDFFSLGGHSLLAMRVATTVTAETGHPATVRDIFEYPTVEKLALHLAAANQNEGGKAVTLVELPPLVPRAADAKAPLSFGQARLWTLERLEMAGTAYVVPVCLRIEGLLDEGALEVALGDLITRHEILSTRICGNEEDAWQEAGAGDISFERRSGETAQAAADLWTTPFDLSKEYPLRIALVKGEAGRALLILVLHHIAVDAWSLDIVLRDLALLYKSRLGMGASPSPLPVQYADFALWQRGWLQGEVLERQLSYWRNQLSGAPQTLPLPTDRPRPAVQDYSGGNVPVRFGAELSTAIRGLAQREGATVFMVLLAAYQTLLARWSGQWDLSVGTPVANRRDAQLEGLVGFFANTLVMRSQMSPEMRFVDHLSAVRVRVLEAFAHQDLPFEKLVEEIAPDRDLSRHPIFQAMLTLQGAAEVAEMPKIEGLRIAPEPVKGTWAKFDQTLFVTDDAGELSGRLEYATALFDQSTAERMVASFIEILTEVVANPECDLGGVSIISQEKQEYLKALSRGPNLPVQADGLRVEALFEQVAAGDPAAIALRCGELECDYGLLLSKTSALAAHLNRQGIGQGDVVGVLMTRGIEMPEALLGVLKAGAAYLPLDPGLPSSRLDFIVGDAQVAAVLTSSDLVTSVPEGIDCILLDEVDDNPGSDPIRENRLTAADPAYVIYTSGSTGKPKGVVLSHKGMVNYLLWARDAYITDAVEPDQALALFHGSFSYDMSVTSLFLPLISGYALDILPAGEDLAVLEDAFQGRPAPYLLKLTPAHLRALADQFTPDRAPAVLVVGGEALPADTVAKIKRRLPNVRIVNEYGPTETVVGCAVFEPEAAVSDPVPIGQPVAQTTLRVLGVGGELQPEDVVGELYIGGAGVAQGYLNRPALTAERFLPDPEGGPGARAYRTGDLVRWRTDGLLEYLGRNDDQVKIRGFRVELGEIEAALAAVPGVEAAAVVAGNSDSGALRLIGYFVGDLSEKTIRAQLAQRLPAHMVPNVLVALDCLPLTPAGKVDRRALPQPDSKSRVADGRPQSDAELRLAQIWCDVLGLDAVGPEENFFSLGGDSILALMVVSRARSQGIVITPRDLFEAQTVAGLAALSSVNVTSVNDMTTADPGANRSLPAMQWFGALGLLEPRHWNMSGLYIPAQPIDISRLQEAVQTLIDRHDALNMRYHLQGNSWEPAPMLPDEKPEITDLVRDISLGDESELPWTLLDAQRSLNPDVGRNLRVSLIRMKDGSQRLSLIAHHLATDAVSARILLEELSHFLVGKGDELPLSDPAYVYGAGLADWVETREAQAERALWAEVIAAGPTRLPRDLPEGRNLNRYSAAVVRQLDPEETKRLLAKGGTAAQAAMVAALGGALSSWTGKHDMVLSMEGHGRMAPVGVPGDVSRSVGWFTAFWPARVAITGHPDVDARNVLARFDALPPERTGYGALRWLGADGDALAFQSDVSFNYLGVADAAGNDGGFFSPAPEPDAPQRAAGDRRPFVLDVNAVVRDGTLSISFGYATSLHHEETVLDVADETMDRLQRILAAPSSHASSATAMKTKRPDFEHAGLPAGELAELLDVLDGD